MHRRELLAILPSALILHASRCFGADSKKPALQLFGTTLKLAKRSDLRKVFRQSGLRPTREDDRYWVDTYKVPDGILEGATEFEAAYLLTTGTFAYARYKFPGFMDTKLVGKVVRMVQGKYGAPIMTVGREELGPMMVEWSAGNGMWIQVSRDWPDTTTYLKYEDTMANAILRKEMSEEKARQELEKSKSQTNAF